MRTIMLPVVFLVVFCAYSRSVCYIQDCFLFLLNPIKVALVGEVSFGSYFLAPLVCVINSSFVYLVGNVLKLSESDDVMGMFLSEPRTLQSPLFYYAEQKL